MRADSNARSSRAAGAEDDQQEAPSIPRVVSEQARLAHEFLATLENPRAPWAQLYEAFADERGLSQELRRSTKVAVLKIRTFGAIERSRRRRP